MGRGPNWEIFYIGPPLAGKKSSLVWMQEAQYSNSSELISFKSTSGEFIKFTMNYSRQRLAIQTFSGDCIEKSTGKIYLQVSDGHIETSIKNTLFPKHNWNFFGKWVLGHGIVFVADSQESRMKENLQSLRELEEILAKNGKDIRQFPLVFQWNCCLFLTYNI